MADDTPNTHGTRHRIEALADRFAAEDPQYAAARALLRGVDRVTDSTLADIREALRTNDGRA